MTGYTRVCVPMPFGSVLPWDVIDREDQGHSPRLFNTYVLRNQFVLNYKTHK